MVVPAHSPHGAPPNVAPALWPPVPLASPSRALFQPQSIATPLSLDQPWFRVSPFPSSPQSCPNLPCPPPIRPRSGTHSTISECPRRASAVAMGSSSIKACNTVHSGKNPSQVLQAWTPLPLRAYAICGYAAMAPVYTLLCCYTAVLLYRFVTTSLFPSVAIRVHVTSILHLYSPRRLCVYM